MLSYALKITPVIFQQHTELQGGPKSKLQQTSNCIK